MPLKRRVPGGRSELSFNNILYSDGIGAVFTDDERRLLAETLIPIYNGVNEDVNNLHYHKYGYHIAPMIKSIVANEPVENHRKFLLAAIFHDAIYNPKLPNNEEESIELFNGTGEMFAAEKADVIEMIEATKYQTPASEIAARFLKYDLEGFTKSLYDVLNDEKQIRKEYAFVDWSIYRDKRIEILERIMNSKFFYEEMPPVATQNIEAQIQYLNFCTPNIGVYPGSFNPFHKGHMNILEQAEKVFDKVILLFATNPDKNYDSRKVPEVLRYHQVEIWDKSITEFIKSKDYNLTVVRGIRNTTDFGAEQNYIKWLNELSNGHTQCTTFICDKEYEHISSTALKQIRDIDFEIYNRYTYD